MNDNRSRISAKSRRRGLQSLLKASTMIAGANLLLMAPVSALAQTAAPADATAALEEVVVTANRVETTAQRTAIAMDVISQDTLKQQGITNIANLSLASPSVNIASTVGGAVVTIRGISSRDTTEIGDPAVAIAVDGFYQDRAYAVGLAQYDLERVEVLRGPQGTLYGRNATGGAINIYTARPGREAGGYIQVEGGNYSTLNTEGALNVPLTDRFSVRASFGTQYHTGYRNTPPYGDADDANARSGRIQFLWRPVDALSIRFLAQHTDQNASGFAQQMIPYRVDANGFVLHDRPVIGDPKTYEKAGPSTLILNDSVYKLNVEYTTPFATLAYLGGYDRLKYEARNPGFFYLTPATAANPIPPFQRREFHQREAPITTNHEFRLISPDPEARFTWQAGVFYYKNTNLLDSFNNIPNGTPSPTPVIHFNYDVSIKSLAEMVHVGFKITPDLKLTAGYRHNDDEKQRTGYIFFAVVRPPTAVPQTFSTTIKKDTVHVGLDWQVNSRSLVYAKYDTGYKSGGFTDIAPYGPETVKTWEVGSKNRFFDNRVQFNIDGYYSTYSGQQVQQIVQGGGTLRIVNAGETRLWGVESEIVAALDVGRFELNVAYLNAEFTDFLLATAVPRFNGTAWTSSNLSYQLEGNSPQQAPKWTVGAAYQYTFKDVFGGSLTPRVQLRYQSKQYLTFFNQPDDTLKANAVTNFYLTYQPSNADWQVQGYVRNVTDEDVFVTAGPNDRYFNYSYAYQPPRTYGVQLRYTW